MVIQNIQLVKCFGWLIIAAAGLAVAIIVDRYGDQPPMA